MADDKMYTEEELQHRLAREVAKQRLGDMERKIEEGEGRVAMGFAELKTQIGGLSNQLTSQSLNMEKATDDLRKEIKNEFASKEELDYKFMTLNTKIDTQWSKLVLIVSVISFIGTAFSGIVLLFLKWSH